MCQVTLPPQYAAHLLPYVSISWSTPNLITAELKRNSNQIVREVVNSENLMSSLIFSSLSASHNGNYSCQAIVTLRNGTLMEIGGSGNVLIFFEG